MFICYLFTKVDLSYKIRTWPWPKAKFYLLWSKSRTNNTRIGSSCINAQLLSHLLQLQYCTHHITCLLFNQTFTLQLQIMWVKYFLSNIAIKCVFVHMLAHHCNALALLGHSQCSKCVQNGHLLWKVFHGWTLDIKNILVYWLMVYWFICTIKQDILQITVLYHVGSPVDEPP